KEEAMRRLSLCLVAALGALVGAPGALADGGPFLVTQGGSGVATHDGSSHYVTISNGNGATILERVDVAGSQVNSWIPLAGSWGTPILGPNFQTGQGLSQDGRTLVLSSTAAPYGPTSTFLVVDTRRMRVVRPIVLRGSFSFDAVSPNASRMYLIQYKSA